MQTLRQFRAKLKKRLKFDVRRLCSQPFQLQEMDLISQNNEMKNYHDEL